MPGTAQAIEAYPVTHLPSVNADADQRDLVGLIHDFVPTEMDVDAGPIGLGLVGDTLSGRSPLDRWEELFAHQDPELLVGKTLPPHAFHDDPVGRVRDRLDDMNTMKIVTACAVRATARVGVERRYGHFDTTSRRVWGDDQGAEEQDVPFRVPYGESQDQRPDLKPFVLSTLCVDRTGPMWGTSEDGHASDKTLNTTLLSAIATILARHGVAPGAYRDVADAALVTEDNLAALGPTLVIRRLPATYTACARVIQEAVARDGWEDIGILATTKATQQRPAPFDKAYEGDVALYGQTYRAMVVQSTAQDTRRLPRVARDVHASAEELQVVVRVEDTQASFCQAEAEVAAARLRARQTPDHELVVTVEERPQYGRGRPRQHVPRAVNTMRDGLKCTHKERDATSARQREAAGCCVVRTKVPTEGDLAHRAGDVLKGDKNP